MLTLNQIIQNLYRFDPNGTRINGIEFVKATSLRVGYSKSISDGKGGYIVRSICKTRTPNVTSGYDNYVTTIDFVSPKGYVRISCSCPDFWSMFEWALSKQGAAEIHYSNGDPPKEKNPSAVPACCIAKGELVTTDKGLVPIENIKIGDKVLTLNGYKSVVDQGLTRKNTPTIRLNLVNGRSLTVTPDHRILISKNGGVPKWLEASDIEQGDSVIGLLPQVSQINLLNSEAIVLGYLISEGGEIGYAPMEPVCQTEFSFHLNKEFGVHHTFDKQHLCEDVLPSRIWKHFGLTRTSSIDKYLPDFVFSKSEEWRVSLLYSLFSGDGWISRDRKAATYGTSSFKLAGQIQSLLNSLGLDSSMSVHNSGVSCTVMYLVRLTSPSVRKLTNLMPLPLKYGKNYLDQGKLTLDSFSKFSTTTLFKEAKEILLSQWLKKNSSKEIVTLIDFAKEQGIGIDKLTKLSITYFKDQLVKVKTGSKKPRRGLPRSTAAACILKDPGQFFEKNIPYICKGLKQPTVRKIKNWLNKLPLTLDQFKYKVNRFMESDISFIKVDSLTHLSTSSVYDLSVEDTPHFVANGIIVHNCKHVVKMANVLKQTGHINSGYRWIPQVIKK